MMITSETLDMLILRLGTKGETSLTAAKQEIVEKLVSSEYLRQIPGRMESPSANGSQISTRINSSKSKLVRKGLVEGTKRGFYKTTEMGKLALAAPAMKECEQLLETAINRVAERKAKEDHSRKTAIERGQDTYAAWCFKHGHSDYHVDSLACIQCSFPDAWANEWRDLRETDRSARARAEKQGISQYISPMGCEWHGGPYNWDRISPIRCDTPRFTKTGECIACADLRDKRNRERRIANIVSPIIFGLIFLIAIALFGALFGGGGSCREFARVAASC